MNEKNANIDDYVRKINFLKMSNHILNYEVGENPPPNLVIENFIKNIDLVKENDFIFCRSDYMINGQLLKVINLLKVKINVIIHGGDYLINYPWLDSPMINNIFCANLNANLNFKLTKLIPIPWGWGEVRHGDSSKEELDKIWNNRKKFAEKNNKVYIPHHTGGYSDSPRQYFWETLTKSKLWDSTISLTTTKVDKKIYENNINESKFCVVLPGASWANQPLRIWECLIRETIPIMKRSFSDWWKSGVELMAKNHEIPMIFVDDWDEIDESIFEKEFNFVNLKNKLKHYYWEQYIKNCALLKQEK
jgi:hypothetical protein